MATKIDRPAGFVPLTDAVIDLVFLGVCEQYPDRSKRHGGTMLRAFVRAIEAELEPQVATFKRNRVDDSVTSE